MTLKLEKLTPIYEMLKIPVTSSRQNLHLLVNRINAFTSLIFYDTVIKAEDDFSIIHNISKLKMEC
jgi:hypothetical protein